MYITNIVLTHFHHSLSLRFLNQLLYRVQYVKLMLTSHEKPIYSDGFVNILKTTSIEGKRKY